MQVKSVRVLTKLLGAGVMGGAGGMSEEESTLNLQALQDEVKRLGVQTPWRLTFSYGRALQSATLKVRPQHSGPLYGLRC